MKNLSAINEPKDVVNKEYVDANIGQKQDTLVSGTNIKTINGESLLDSGNIDVLTRDKLFFETATESIPYYYAGIKSLENVGIISDGQRLPLIDALEMIAIRSYSGNENITLINQIIEYIIKYGTVPASVKDNTIFTVEMPGLISAIFQLDSEDNTRINRMWVVNHGWDFAPYTLEASGSINSVTINVMYIGQNKLISGENIKTINNQSLLGSGNITVEQDSNKVTSISSSSTDDQYPSAKAVYDYIQSLDANEVSY